MHFLISIKYKNILHKKWNSFIKAHWNKKIKKLTAEDISL